LLGGVSFNKVLGDRTHAVQHDDTRQQHGHAKQKRTPVGLGIRSGHGKIFSLAISLILFWQFSRTRSFEDPGYRKVKNIARAKRLRIG
jgi:hypothetical protein